MNLQDDFTTWYGTRYEDENNILFAKRLLQQFPLTYLRLPLGNRPPDDVPQQIISHAQGYGC